MLITSCAKHYYDEDDIEIGKPLQCQVSVNHIVELTEEEKADARQNAIRQYQNAERQKLENRNKKPTAKQATQIQQTSLFDF